MEKSYDFKFIDFLATNNTIIIHNEMEFNKFKKILKKFNMLGVLKGSEDYNEWVSLAKINLCYNGYIIFEYQNSKGLTFGYSIESSTNWYGVEPINVYDLESEV